MPHLFSVLVVLGLAIFLFCPLHVPCCAATVIGDTLAAGQALAAGDKLVSRNGKFALGFFQFQQSLGGGTTVNDNSEVSVEFPPDEVPDPAGVEFETSESIPEPFFPAHQGDILEQQCFGPCCMTVVLVDEDE